MEEAAESKVLTGIKIAPGEPETGRKQIEPAKLGGTLPKRTSTKPGPRIRLRRIRKKHEELTGKEEPLSTEPQTTEEREKQTSSQVFTTQVREPAIEARNRGRQQTTRRHFEKGTEPLASEFPGVTGKGKSSLSKPYVRSTKGPVQK